MTAIYNKYQLNNRENKRTFKRDATRAAEFLQHIIDDFVDALFDSPNHIMYSTIYLYYLDKWKATIKHIQNTLKPKLKNIIIDDKFFSENYSPTILTSFS